MQFLPISFSMKIRITMAKNLEPVVITALEWTKPVAISTPELPIQLVCSYKHCIWTFDPDSLSIASGKSISFSSPHFHLLYYLIRQQFELDFHLVNWPDALCIWLCQSISWVVQKASQNLTNFTATDHIMTCILHRFPLFLMIFFYFRACVPIYLSSTLSAFPLILASCPCPIISSLSLISPTHLTALYIHSQRFYFKLHILTDALYIST